MLGVLTDRIDALCITCKHRRPMATCAAYPDGIPAKFMRGEKDHNQPEPGDNGIQYSPRTTSPP
jgi:hypothetical protein